MFTAYTYQDWLKLGGGPEAAKAVVESYRASAFFQQALKANRYFAGENPTLDSKYLMQVQTREQTGEDGFTRRYADTVQVPGNRVSSSFLRRFVCQQNQYLLGNGVTLADTEQKKRLGRAFDVAIQQIGENALIHGVSYGYWNYDHLEPISAAQDANTGCAALLDEVTGEVGAAVQFWQLSSTRPMYLRVFEPDGVTMYSFYRSAYQEVQSKRTYKQLTRRDALGVEVIGGSNYPALPLIPLYANDEHRSELTLSIQSKIDLYDRITSDFGDNLDRSNDVYWVLNNFGGSTDDALQAIQEINRLKVAMSMQNPDGSGSSAEPRTIEVPYAARQVALELLESALYQDYMALSMKELTGGSLTNVAIQTATTNLNLKCDHYEWQCFAFVQKVLALIGIETEEISFQRQQIVNRSETVQDIYTMRGDIDLETALRLNPYISPDEIPNIMEALDAETASGKPNMDALQRQIDQLLKEGEDDND